SNLRYFSTGPVTSVVRLPQIAQVVVLLPVGNDATAPAQDEPMPAAVFLIVGPAGTGKTHALIDRHRAVSAGAVGTGLWLVPTERAADALRPRLLGPNAACLVPNLLTIPDFARRLVRAA